MPGTPFMARSIMVSVDFTSTSALEPGNSMKIFTRGGAISGNWDIGKVKMANIPKKTIAIDNAIAKTGLFINLLNMVFYFFKNRLSILIVDKKLCIFFKIILRED
jgi:hypothetical protein